MLCTLQYLTPRQFTNLTEEGLERIPMYRTLVEYISRTQHDAEEMGKQLQSARAESEKLREQCAKLELGLEVTSLLALNCSRS